MGREIDEELGDHGCSSLSLMMEDVLAGQWQPQLLAKRPVIGRHAGIPSPTFIFPSSI